MFLIQSSPKVFIAKSFLRVPPSLFSMDKPISSGSNFGAYLPFAAKATPAPWQNAACVNRKISQALQLRVICELYAHNYICLCSKYCDHLTFSIDWKKQLVPGVVDLCVLKRGIMFQCVSTSNFLKGWIPQSKKESLLKGWQKPEVKTSVLILGNKCANHVNRSNTVSHIVGVVNKHSLKKVL